MRWVFEICLFEPNGELQIEIRVLFLFRLCNQRLPLDC